MRVAQITTNESGIRSQNRMRMSDMSRLRRPAGISRHSRSGLASASFFSFESSSIITCCNTAAASANASAHMNATRTPCPTPQTAMQAPPATGPNILGTRRTSEMTDTPMARRFFGTAFDSKSMVAGKEMADQEMKKAAPTSTAHQVWMKMTHR